MGIISQDRIEQIASDLGHLTFNVLDSEQVATDDAGLAQAMVEQQLRRFLKAQYGPGAWEHHEDGGVFTHSYLASKIRRFDQRVDALNWLICNHDLDNPVMVAGELYHPVNREATAETNKLLNEVLDKVMG